MSCKNIFLAFAILCCIPWVNAQGVNIGSNTNPDPSAILEISGTNGGLLIPRLTTLQRNAIANPAAGLHIYNLDDNCVQVYMPISGWSSIACDCQVLPSSAFTYPNTININSPVNISASTPGLNYSWTFQGGSPSTGTNQTESVTWAATGTYTVTLTVTDNQGCSSTTTHTVTVVNCPPPFQNTVSFSFNGNMQTWVVPSCVTAIQVDARGAQGGTNNGTGGLGGRVQATLTVTPGETLYIYVGGQPNPFASAGYNGGGAGLGSGGGGGGGTDIRRGGMTLVDRVLVAGGGGGGSQGNGGVGGGLTGGQGSTNGNGVWAQGGTQSAGGAGGMYNNGSCAPGSAFAPDGALGVGGAGLSNSACCCYGAGGGGGYYGGGGMQINGAGGGSSYVTNIGSSGITHTQGFQSGNGAITIVY